MLSCSTSVIVWIWEGGWTTDYHVTIAVRLLLWKVPLPRPRNAIDERIDVLISLAWAIDRVTTPARIGIEEVGGGHDYEAVPRVTDKLVSCKCFRGAKCLRQGDVGPRVTGKWGI